MSNVPPLAPPPVEPSPRFPRKQLDVLLRTVSGVQVAWVTRARPELGRKPLTERAWLDVSVQTILRDGVDEQRLAYDAATDQNDVILIGQRQATLVIEAWSGTGELDAYDLCERIAFRLRTARAIALMKPTIALIDIPTIRQLPGIPVQQRELARASMDVQIAYVLGADPLDPYEGEYIATIDPPTVDATTGGDGTDITGSM